MSLNRPLFPVHILLLGALACGPAGGDDSSSGAAPGSEAAGTPTSTAGETDEETSPGTGSTSADASGAGESSTGASSLTANAESGAADGSIDPVDPQPLGASCTIDAGCESELCRITAADDDGQLRGVCSECINDLGCQVDEIGLNCTRKAGENYYVCSNGALTESCDDSDGCGDGLFCADIGRNIRRCSECDRDQRCQSDDGDDTNDTQICGGVSYQVQSGEIVAYRHCVEPGSLARSQACAPGESGQTACSDRCVETEIDGSRRLGVCGQCRNDEDCSGGTCTPGQINGAQLQGSSCQGGGDTSMDTGDTGSEDGDTTTM